MNSERARRIIGNSLIVFGDFALIASAIGKLVGAPKMVEGLNRFGFEGKVHWLGALELLCAMLFLIPASRLFGLLMVSAFMGGAIATHLQHADSAISPGVILAILWSGIWIRYAGLFHILRGTPRHAGTRRGDEITHYDDALRSPTH
jgi:hypothetical protein